MLVLMFGCYTELTAGSAVLDYLTGYWRCQVSRFRGFLQANRSLSRRNINQSTKYYREFIGMYTRRGNCLFAEEKFIEDTFSNLWLLSSSDLSS